MHNASLRIALLASSLIACSSANNSRHNAQPDAPMQQAQPDAPEGVDAPMQPADGPTAATCGSTTSVVLGAQDILADDSASNAMVWGGDVTTDLGDGGGATFTLEFYGGIEPNLATTIDLTSGNQANYSSCAECVRVITKDSTGNPVRTYFQSGGSVTLAMDPITNKHMMGSITNLALTEVTIDPDTYVSTPVANGKCIMVGSVTLDHDAVPNAWTCSHNDYNDGTNCDCACGTADPDCSIAAAPVHNCTGNQVCSPTNTCVDRPTNDTCQTATALTVGTPVTGTSLAAAANYDTGSAGCTGYAESGPDVAYAITLAAATSYTFTLSNVDPGFDPAIAIIGPGDATACDATTPTCVAGADAGLSGDGETLTYTPMAAGTYYVIIDTYDSAATGGAFTLSVTAP